MKLKIEKSQSNFLQEMGTEITTPNGEKYFYMPFWFKQTEEEGVYELLTFDHLPKDVIELIHDFREGK